jgi:molybdopterin-containing oxidoreductase family membrane subunit
MIDSALIPEGVKRCPFWQFLLALAVAGAVLLWGLRHVALLVQGS